MSTRSKRSDSASMTEKNKGGRPTVVLDESQIAQVEALGSVLSIEQIADYFGIGRTTFYSVMNRQPEVAEHYKRGKAKAIGSVAQGLLKKAREGDTASAIFYLKTQAGWRETTAIDHSSSDGTMSMPSRIEIVAPQNDNGQD